MKISKCKKELARIISENGGWVDGEAIFAAMDGNGDLFGYSGKPQWTVSHGHWYGHTLTCWFFSPVVMKNHHQTILSREEYYQAYPKADADGWIEWFGGECPIDGILIVDVKFANGIIYRESSANSHAWASAGAPYDIIAYRLHKPEQAGATDKLSSEAVSAAKIALMSDSIEELVRKPTIEQLAADYRNKLDYANRKQQEADAAKAGAEAKLTELVAAGKVLGLVIDVKH